jgi:putative protease
MDRSRSLPLIADRPAPPQWHGYTPAEAAPEPDAPQGEYAMLGEERSVPLVEGTVGPVELLAPAGGPDAAFAAFHYGADAVYLGLKKFSARAEAENFTLEELSEAVAYAHSLTPRRRVFVTINTLLRDDELPELIESLAALEEIGVDALIIQDLGVYHIARQHFPKLELHASTQLAVHNRAGAEALKALGFTRVVLARELTFEEVHDITATSGIETEVFIHGALCYSYSGLCLFSSQTLGRSGNRGKCAYSCRDSYTVTGAPTTLRDGTQTRRDPSTGFPFSMKDLALPDHIPALRSAGVSCFKIEGRKKSPLYVATTSDYYRKLIDGTMQPEDRPEHEADLQTVFSRPWTRLFTDSHKDKEVADRDTVGHRGTVIGRIEAVTGARRSARLRFRTSRALERHDGLQVDLESLSRPFGFAVSQMWVLHGRRSDPTFEAPAGALVEVELPADHPDLPIGAPVYCSSSQAVKRKYRHGRPKPGLYHTRFPMSVELKVEASRVTATATSGSVSATRSVEGTFTPARDAGATAEAARAAFDKLGDTALTLETFTLHDPQGLFVPVSRLNALRRDVVAALEEALHLAREGRVAEVIQKASGGREPTGAAPAAPAPREAKWVLKTDRLTHLDAFTAADWENVAEVIIDIARDHPTVLAERLDALGAQLGRHRIRLALPPLTRKWEERGIVHKVARLRAAGWHKWEAGNLSAWSYLAPLEGIDLAADWSVYVLNRAAARQLLSMGVTRFTLSPEDGLANMKALLDEFAEIATAIVYQDTPQFLAESCAYANLIGGCPGKANCSFESMQMVSSHGEKVTALDYHCRTIVLDQGPFCLSPHLDELREAGAVNFRVDFVYIKYGPDEAVERWRAVRAGRPVPGGHAANFRRGVL